MILTAEGITVIKGFPRLGMGTILIGVIGIISGYKYLPIGIVWQKLTLPAKGFMVGSKYYPHWGNRNHIRIQVSPDWDSMAKANIASKGFHGWIQVLSSLG